MSLLSFLQGIGGVGVRHGFTLNNEGDNVADDFGNSSDPTRIVTTTNYSFQTSPVCLGFTHCARSTSSTNESIDAIGFDNRNDINGSNGAGNDSSSFDYVSGTQQMVLWCRQLEIWNVTCIMEKGGGVNNHAFMGGARNTWQSADAGQPFDIVPGKTLTVVNRPILHHGGWEYRTAWGGASNRSWYCENGIMQGYSSEGATATFPGHSGDWTILNSGDALKTFNENTLASETVAKEGNLALIINNPAVVSLNEGDVFPDGRELFERTVLAENVITGTRAQQQASLDALSGTVFQNVNCAIEIRQATDEAGDYELTLNNIQFVENANLRDIAVMFTSPNTLSLTNANGSNAAEISTPPERELIFNDAGSIIIGGGTIVLQTSRTFTFNVEWGGTPPTDYEYRIYVDDPAPGIIGTVELQGAENETATTINYNYVFSANQNIRVQIIAEGYVEVLSPITVLGNSDQSITLTPQIDTNL